MMEEALYGRMQLGTCLKIDMGYMDCSRYGEWIWHLSKTLVHEMLFSILKLIFIYVAICRDVLLIMDRLCSGQQSCRVRVVQLEEFISPCPEVVSYLQARYTCLEGGLSFLKVLANIYKIICVWECELLWVRFFLILLLCQYLNFTWKMCYVWIYYFYSHDPTGWLLCKTCRE